MSLTRPLFLPTVVFIAMSLGTSAQAQTADEIWPIETMSFSLGWQDNSSGAGDGQVLTKTLSYGRMFRSGVSDNFSISFTDIDKKNTADDTNFDADGVGLSYSLTTPLNTRGLLGGVTLGYGSSSSIWADSLVEITGEGKILDVGAGLTQIIPISPNSGFGVSASINGINSNSSDNDGFSLDRWQSVLVVSANFVTGLARLHEFSVGIEGGISDLDLSSEGDNSFAAATFGYNFVPEIGSPIRIGVNGNVGLHGSASDRGFSVFVSRRF